MAQRPTSAQMRFDTLAEIVALGTSVRDGQKAYARDTAREYRYTTAGGWEVMPIKSEVDGKSALSHTHSISNITGLQSALDAKKTIRVINNGVVVNGTPQTGDILIHQKTVTTSGGGAIIYPTSDGTASGTALFSSIYNNTIDGNLIDPTGVYSKGSPTVAGNFKTVTIPYNKQGFNILVVLGLNVLGSPSMGAIPNGVTVNTEMWGVAA